MINKYIYKSLYKFISTGMLIRHKLLNSPKGLGKGALIHDIYMSHETVPGLQGLGIVRSPPTPIVIWLVSRLITLQWRWWVVGVLPNSSSY